MGLKVGKRKGKQMEEEECKWSLTTGTEAYCSQQLTLTEKSGKGPGVEDMGTLCSPDLPYESPVISKHATAYR
jgi:hypothetical protein